ncbi:MAG: hypothetical protein IKL22_10240 [Lachnospiraceae bacterium]|nr:hypothetical protein [Lachnospiraceae bacterium]
MKKRENNREKGFILAVCILGMAFLMLLVLNIFYGDHWLDSDMAAEMIFAKQIAEEGGYFTTPNWYYSTEFRLLYTQLFMVPLFHIFEDWHVIRVITNVLTYVLMLGSYYYFMKPLKVSKTKVVLSSVLLLLPFSETFVTHMQMGNTYMPHVIIVFFCFGMFLRLVQQTKILEKKRIILLVIYTLLSVVCGMSGVRYMLALQVPLVLTAVYYVFSSTAFTSLREKFDKENLKNVCKGEGFLCLVYSIYSAFFALVGYAFNVVVIARKFPFQTYEVTNFIKVFQGVLLERLQDTVGNLLMLFGYIEEKGFLSLRGLISIIAFALLAGIVLLTKSVKTLATKKGKEADLRSFIRYFFVIAFMLNTFVFVFTTSTIVSRYYITVFIFVLPLLCFYFELEERCLDRWLVLLFLCGCMGLATMKCVYSFIDKDKNAEEKKVVAFLEENGYTFGYASYWNANIMTELSDGVVEVANIADFEDMSFFRWSSPMRYYEADYHQGKTFLLLAEEQREKYGVLYLLQGGNVVYEDETYTVIHFDSVNEVLKEQNM